jgi:2-amino-4-hydroxy-6-hydroxymethyldihydropteridine diphosphokinase
MRIEARSRLYASSPADGAEGPEYLNLAAAVRTALSLPAVLAAGKEAERALGRATRERFAPRPLDVDVLLDGETVIEEEGLVVPHPRLHLRRFVLVPLAEIAPDARHPRLNESIAALLARCPDRAAVRPWAAPGRLAAGGRPDL